MRKSSQKAKCIFYGELKNNEMSLEVDNDEKTKIEKVITSADSPVGIDAKKTHIIIIHKLLEIEKRLAKLEQENKTKGSE